MNPAAWPEGPQSKVLSSRPIILALVGLVLLQTTVSAQSFSLVGEATNLGLAESPRYPGITASLTWHEDQTSPAGGYLQLGPELGGSGPATLLRWSDSLLLVSVSESADTILWIGRLLMDLARGEYLIIGGQFEGQGGVWSLSANGLGEVRTNPPSDDFRRADFLEATAAIRAARSESAIPSWLAPSPRSSYRSPPAPSNEARGEESWILWFMLGIAGVAGLAVAGRRVIALARIRSEADSSISPGQFAIQCPTCGVRTMTECREFWYLRGLLLAAKYGTRRVVGCRYCAHEEGLKHLAINAVAGWWCIPWGFFAPLVIGQNILVLLRPTSSATLEAALRAAGLDPESMRVGSDGLTGEQRTLLHAASQVLSAAIWADGQEHRSELIRAVAILQQFTGGLLNEAAAMRAISGARGRKQPLSGHPIDLRHTLLAMAADVMLADGHLGMPEHAGLRALAEDLGFHPSAADRLLEELGFGTRTDEGQGHNARASAGVSEALRNAWLLLGVRQGASLMEIKRAWRAAMLKYHPDRAGNDTARQAELHHRAQEINAAYELLRRNAGTA